MRSTNHPTNHVKQDIHLMVYHDMHFNCTNIRVVQTIREC